VTNDDHFAMIPGLRLWHEIGHWKMGTVLFSYGRSKTSRFV
jgi:hypothetical protein